MTERPPSGQPPPGQPPPGQPPPGQPPPGPGYPPYYQPKPRHPQALTVLILGLVATAGGVISGGLGFIVGPIAWVMGARAKREIDAEPGRWDGEDLINIGYILGIVGTVLLALGVLVTIAAIVAVIGFVNGWP